MTTASRNATALAAAAFALLATACGSSAPQAAPLTPEDYPGVLVQIGVALSDVPESQRPFFEDGEITFAEYEQAVLAEIACVQGHGLEITSGPDLDPSGLRLTYTGSLATHDADEATERFEIVQECHEAFVSVVLHAWTLATEPTEEQRQAAREALIVCLQELGANLPADATGDQTSSYLHEHPSCFEQVQRDFRIPHFAGY